MNERFERGQQVAYVPPHAEGRLSHPDVEFGFVEKRQGNFAFCRFWRRGYEGKELRTTANPEMASYDLLCPIMFGEYWLEQAIVDKCLERLETDG